MGAVLDQSLFAHHLGKAFRDRNTGLVGLELVLGAEGITGKIDRRREGDFVGLCHLRHRAGNLSRTADASIEIGLERDVEHDGLAVATDNW